ncbi:MAG TPA: sigma-70 family RNA polymerase sigma factor [Planctomycetota bacterium]|nr:sigma-70 family RNA polymerase sigma factor [Planctomycetota bacterium]
MIDEAFSAWRARLQRFCEQLLRSAHDAEEVVQDVFTSLLDRGGHLDLTRDPEVLLFRLARNRCIDVRRKKKAEPHADVDRPARDERPRLELAEALAALRFEEREVLLLTAIDGLGYREAASILGCSLGTVAARRYSAIEKLRRRLAP